MSFVGTFPRSPATRYPERIKVAALRLSQEIGRRNAALALNVSSSSLGNWRSAAGVPHLPRRQEEPDGKCMWCGRDRKRAGFCRAECRRAYVNDAWKESQNAQSKR